ncbi:hypothetical protein CONLIGDRAFT_633994 [Coniochaeta ligniaria NRRL 30616]|uniref:Uncharacterized protein n=1 Tax=Coniochaeta ligniaria NRRL 30616 TaxID=1408157 RepID=A0A1J7IJS9_9PEZI|nr:hypothetical protein CONLIGDRAFT_633994 [Coniochaeta ligniaria NRRL 30616]
MPSQKHATALAQGSRARRQNHSCDQCRKSKRACDALYLDPTRRASFSSVDGQWSPCSYCARTKKRCTMEWARSQARSLKLPRQQPYSERLSRHLLFPWMADESPFETGSGTWDDLLGPSPAQEFTTWKPANVDLSGSLLNYDSVPLTSMLNNNEDPQEEMQAEMSDLLLPDFSSASDISTQQLSDLDLDGMFHQPWPASEASQTSQTYSSLQPTSTQRPRRRSDSAWMSFDQQTSCWNGSQSSLSPFSVNQQMVTTHNNHLTSANLLQIYHDVLEHNLSCWLTEMTCPYQPGPRNANQVMPEWGSSWSNRIYRRTVELDRVAQSSKLLQLTRAEDQAASKAMHLAIMAFATQWAQGSHRHREKYRARSLDSSEDGLADGISDEFDRILQHHFWDRAQRALQQVTDLESYRVACANLIMGLTQRPWNPDNQSPGHERGAQTRRFAADSVASQVRDIIRKEGPPIYMETAARKMHALKYRCDALEKGLGSREHGAHGIAAMSSEDRATIGLLYWLAIMFDTVSSSMNERPVVVLDEDCHHAAQKDLQQAAAPTTDKSPAPTSSQRWNLDLFVQGRLDDSAQQTHWPCPYEAAAQDVVRSAPVKVLLFRHVSYLQNAVRKGAGAEQIEDVVRSTTALYRYWNATHGAFFAQLVADYGAVPHRVRGWFVCISAHWHLAALMLADLLEFVDENALGMEDAASVRVASQMAKRVRKHSAGELADLARVATPPAGRDGNLGALPQMPDFHHAVNEGTLLTEPWTMILIRAFTKACVIFLGEADESLRRGGTAPGHDGGDFEENTRRAEDCIRGLWLLGKKSDMARELAETLSLALGKLRDECGVFGISPGLG